MPVTCTHRRQHNFSSTHKRQNSRTANITLPQPPPLPHKILVVRDEFAPAPNKRRRFDADQTVTEEEARSLLLQRQQLPVAEQQRQLSPSPSPDNWQQPLWDLLKSSYTLLMDDGSITESCKSSEGQADGGNSSEAANESSSYTLVEFYNMWKEHSDWLRQLQLRLQRPAASSAERYLVQQETFADQRAHMTAQKAVSHYASALCLANPRLADDVSAKMRSLQDTWLAVETALEQYPCNEGSLLMASWCADADESLFVPDPLLTEKRKRFLGRKIGASGAFNFLFNYLASDLHESQAWLTAAIESRLEMPADVTQLTSDQKTELLNSVQNREEEIQYRLKAMDSVLKVLERLTDECEPDERVAELIKVAENLRSKFCQLYLELFELKIALEEDFQIAGRPFRGGVSEAAAAAAAAAAIDMPSSWGAESGFVSELSPGGLVGGGNPGDRTMTAGGLSPDSYDVLPFSEDEYERISNQSSEPIFALDYSEQRLRERTPAGHSLTDQRQAAEMTLSRRRRNRDRINDGEVDKVNGERKSTLLFERQKPQQLQQSRCYYRIMTAADSDDSSRPSVTVEASATTASPAAMPTASATTPRRSDNLVGEEDSSSSGGGGACGSGSPGQKRRWTRSSSPLAVVTREIYVDAGALLLGNHMSRAASLGAIGKNDSLSILMPMETANSESNLQPGYANIGLSDFVDPNSTDGSLADESSIGGQSSSPPSPSPAPAPTPTGLMPRRPPALSASATATMNRRQRVRPRPLRSREAVFGQQPQPTPRRLDARRLASKAERYFTRSAGQLCASAVGFISQEDHSGLDNEEECVASCAEGPDDLDQLWDHYQPQLYPVGADEAAEERLDDSHLQWEADQQQFDAGQPGETNAASASVSESESIATKPVSESADGLLAESQAAFAGLSAELRRYVTRFGDIDPTEAFRLAQLAREARRRQVELVGEAHDSDAVLEIVLSSSTTLPESMSSLSSSSTSLSSCTLANTSPRSRLAADWSRLARCLARLSTASEALTEIGAELIEMRANSETAQANLRVAAVSGECGLLADKIQLLKSIESQLHDWLNRLRDLHTWLETACGILESTFTSLAESEPLLKRLAQIRQSHAEQIKLHGRWLASMRESCGSQLFKLGRLQELLSRVGSAFASCQQFLDEKEPQMRLRATVLKELQPGQLKLLLSQGDVRAAEIQECNYCCSQMDSVISECRQQLDSASELFTDIDIAELVGRLSDMNNRVRALRSETDRLLTQISEAEINSSQPSPLATKSVTTSISNSCRGASSELVVNFGGRVSLPGFLLLLLGLCCCLLVMLTQLLRDWQLISISQPDGAPY